MEPATATRQTGRRGRRSAAEAHGTRETILRRAVDVASVEGLEGLTIGRLSADLGMSKSGLFAHFGSKEELQLATLEAAVAIFVREVLEPALAAPAGAERLRALSEHQMSYLERGVFPGGCFLTSAASEFDGRPGPVRDAIRAALGKWLDLLAREAQRAGHPDGPQTAFELNALAVGANQAFQLYGDAAAFARARAAVERRLG